MKHVNNKDSSQLYALVFNIDNNPENKVTIKHLVKEIPTDKTDLTNDGLEVTDVMQKCNGQSNFMGCKKQHCAFMNKCFFSAICILYAK